MLRHAASALRVPCLSVIETIISARALTGGVTHAQEKYKAAGEFEKAKAVLCVHNIAFQGRFWPETLAGLELPESCLDKFAFVDGNPYVYDETETVSEEERKALPKSVKKYPKANWLRAGFLSADKNLTVSPNYALEVASGPDKGVELDDIISQVGIEGIVNGAQPALLQAVHLRLCTLVEKGCARVFAWRVEKKV